jgi:hypothetical protein
VSYPFGPDESQQQSFSFCHQELRISVHMHPVAEDSALFDRYKDQDPLLAWVAIREFGKADPVMTLNAQYDGMMADGRSTRSSRDLRQLLC